METDWFWTTITKGFVAPWKLEAKQQNRVIVRSFAAAAALIAGGGYPVILDGIVGPWNLEIVNHEFEIRNVESDFIVLRPARDVALRRARSRSGEERIEGHRALTDEEPILHMWDQFAHLGQYEAKVIDNSDLDPHQTEALVWNRISTPDAGGTRSRFR